MEGWQQFRDDELWQQDISDTLEANLQHLHKIYNSFTSALHPKMDLRDCHDLCIREDNDKSMNVREPDVTFAYGMCKMTVVAEISNFSNTYSKLEFVEFLEFVARIATARFRKIMSTTNVTSE